MKIIGAGLAGLLAGNIFQRAQLFEAGPESQLSHRAVLRFRSSAVGEAVGIDFRPVTVRKGIWLENKFVRPSIQLANFYAKKVVNRFIDRSIWDLEPVTRFIAPENLVEQMAERCKGRITWCEPFEGPWGKEDIVSTIPMPLLVKALLSTNDWQQHEFHYSPITVRRWRVPKCDVFQTIYFPDPRINLYRASITGDLLIAEFMREEDAFQDLENMIAAFGIEEADPIDSAKQKFGKIAPIDDERRRQFILHATLNHRVYSLGRFATWRNILLDDVLHDIAVIKKLIQGGAYLATRKM